LSALVMTQYNIHHTCFITLHYIRKRFIVAWVRVTSRTTMAT